MTLPINLAVKCLEATHASLACLQFLSFIHATPTLEVIMGMLAIASLLHIFWDLIGWCISLTRTNRKKLQKGL